MPIVKTENVHKSFGPEIIFDNLSLVIYRGEKIGFIGDNGSGKTTLFKLLTGNEKADIGKIIKNKNLRIAYLPQEPILNDSKTVIQQVHQGFEDILKLQVKIDEISHKLSHLKDDQLAMAMREYDRLNDKFKMAGGYEYETQVHKVLTALGLDESFYNIKTSNLSGGQKSRLGLAMVLLRKSDLLLLDEPTNHLDLAGCLWLEKFIKNHAGAAIVISHDRYLLDNISSKIMHLENRDIKIYKGNYSQFVENRNKDNLAEQREYEKRKEFINSTLDFIARNKNQEGMRGTALGRKKRLEKLLKENPGYLKKPTHQKNISFAFEQPKKQSYKVLNCRQLCKSYDKLVLFKDLSFEITAGKRLGITGPNGTGKTTLLKIALGEVKPDSGKIEIGKTVTTGYLDQQGQELNQNIEVLEYAKTIDSKSSITQLRSKLAGFGFTGDDVFKKISDLSGGQQNRLILFSIITKNPELLLLDEPTNHLDITTREMLEEALSEYKGTIIAVSHDRFFMDKIAREMLIIGSDEMGSKKMGAFEFVQGNYSNYVKTIEQRKQKTKQQQSTSGAVKRRSKQNKTKKTTPKHLKKFNAWSVEKIEMEIEQTEDSLKKLQEKFGQEKVYKNPQKFSKLQNEFDNTQKQIELLYQAYQWRIG